MAINLAAVSTGDPASANYNPALPDASPISSLPTIGQLSIGVEGSSRFFGPTAAAHLLSDDEISGPPALPDNERNGHGIPTLSDPHPSFPVFMDSRRQLHDLEGLFDHLPPLERMQQCLNNYWTASAWRFEPISRPYLDKILLDLTTSHPHRRGVKAPSQLAVVFGVLAIGYLFDPQLPPHPIEAYRYHDLSLSALTAAAFLTNTSPATMYVLSLLPTGLILQFCLASALLLFAQRRQTQGV
jgi:hypothetical protein